MTKQFNNPRHAFWSGVRTIMAMAPGIVPFGAIIGVTARDMDMSLLATLAMSMGYYAGAAQIASLQLMADGAVLLVVLLTTLLIGLRFGLYSAAIAPYLQGVPRIQRLPLLYALTDQSFNLSIVNYRTNMAPELAYSYFVGTSIAVWVIWLFAVLLGATLGEAIPNTWSLEFFIPLTFISILLPILRGKDVVGAALVAAIVTMLGQGLPYNLGLMLGACGGIAAGLLIDHYSGVEDE
ncbi:MAG TPA: branched-chain amino acid permease [Oceanospirillaceae bacterium]|nr:branched-chain amino acid permease [Oceanospirillaceae bacterium]